MTARHLSVSIAAGVAVAFGLASVVSGGRALFGGVDRPESQGLYAGSRSSRSAHTAGQIATSAMKAKRRAAIENAAITPRHCLSARQLS